VGSLPRRGQEDSARGFNPGKIQSSARPERALDVRVGYRVYCEPRNSSSQDDIGRRVSDLAAETWDAYGAAFSYCRHAIAQKAHAPPGLQTSPICPQSLDRKLGLRRTKRRANDNDSSWHKSLLVISKARGGLGNLATFQGFGIAKAVILPGRE
jgi:hypothetical protein